MNKHRNINFEVLRVFAMFCIIVNHLINSIGFRQENDIKSNILLSFFYMFVLCGVNLFFMISGYFRIKYSKRKVIRFIVDVYIYSGVITILGVAFDKIDYSSDTLKILLNPLGNYWFLGVYAILMIFSPFLNRIIDCLTLKEYFHKGIFFVFLFCVWNLYINAHFELTSGQHILWAIFLYIFGAGMSKFRIENKFVNNKYIWLCGYLLSAIANFCFYTFLSLYLQDMEHAQKFLWNNSVFVLTSAICLIRFIEQLNISCKWKKVILFAGGHTFGIYILHSSNWMSTFFRNPPILWAEQHMILEILIIFIFIYAMIVYGLCCVVDEIKIKILGTIIDKITEWILICINGILSIIDKVIGAK